MVKNYRPPAVAAVLAVVVLAACSSNSSGSGGGGGSPAVGGGPPKPGVAVGTLTGAMASGAIDSMDPNRWYFAVTWGLANALCTTLVRYADQPGTAGTSVVPRTANLPTVSSNGLVWTFTPRPGATFANRQPITPADLQYTLIPLIAPAANTGA